MSGDKDNKSDSKKMAGQALVCHLSCCKVSVPQCICFRLFCSQ